MNILVIAAYGLYENLSASFVHNQAKAYVQMGHKVRAIVPVALGKNIGDSGRIKNPIVSETADGVEIYYIRYLSLGHYGENTFNPRSAVNTVMKNLDKLLCGFTPDVIHAQAVLFAGRIGAEIKDRLNIPLVITTHGGDTDLALKPEQAPLAESICARADAVVAVSELYREKAMRFCDKTPVSCILNGFEAKNISVKEKILHSVIQTNYLIPRKHTELTIKAVSLLKDTYPDIRLTVVGRGAELENLKALAADLGISERVEFCGFLPNDKAMEKMAESRVFVMPSELEGFGIAYIEAMAGGCVTIGTQGEGISCFIKDGENGFLIAPNSVEDIAAKISFIFDNPALADEIAQRGRKDALELTWEKNAKQYSEIFHTLV